MTTKTHDDLAQIVSNLSESIATIDQSISEHTARAASLTAELASIGQNKANYAGDLQSAQQRVMQVTQEKRSATTDLTLSKGTSVEAEKHQALKVVQSELKRAEAELATLQASFEHDSRAEQDTGAAILETQNAIAALQLERSDLQETRSRFSQEQANHVRQLGLEMLSEIDSEIASLQAKLDQARSYREDALRKLARDLAPWPDLAVSTLASVANFTPGADAQLLTTSLQLLNQLHDASPQAQRLALRTVPLVELQAVGGLASLRQREESNRLAIGSRESHNVPHTDPNLRGLLDHVAHVEQVLGDLQAKQQEVSASALLSEIMQTSS